MRIIKEGDEFEPEEMATFSNKAELLNEELKTLSKNISSKLDILKAYVAFLKSAKEVYISSLLPRPHSLASKENEDFCLA